MDSLRPSILRSALVISVLSAAAVLSAACSTYDSTSRKVANAITPYRINIVQGNFVSREAAAQLREGMTREQVKFLLGTPLLADMFHGDRYDYVFSFKRGNTAVVQQRRYTVFFDGDKLVKFGGDELPSEYELIAEIDGIKNGRKAARKVETPAPAQPVAVPSAAAAEPAATQASAEAPAAQPAPTDAAAASSVAPDSGTPR